MSAPPMPYSWETSGASPHAEFMMSIKPGCRGDPRMNKAVAAKLKNPHISLFDALDIGGFTYPRNVDAATMDDSRVTLGQRKNQLNRRLRMARQNQKNAELKKKKQKEEGGNQSSAGKKEPGSPSSNKPRGTSPLVIANSYLRQKRNAKSSAKPSSCEAAKRAATTKIIINEQPQSKKQRLSVASSTSSSSCGVPSSSVSCPSSTSNSDLLLGNNSVGMSLNFVLNQTINPINGRGQQQGSVTPVMGDNTSSSFPTLPLGNVASAFAATTNNLPNASMCEQAVNTSVSPAQDDATAAWLSANFIGGSVAGGFEDSAVEQLKIDVSNDFTSSSLASLPVEQNATILGLPLALGLDNNSANNSSTSCVSVSSADGSLQLQQQPVATDATNSNTLLPQTSGAQAPSDVGGGACGGQPVGLGDSELQQQQEVLSGARPSDNSVDMDSRREDLGLRLFQSGLQDLYRKSMMAAGFSSEDANECSPTFHRFAFQAWKNECERLQVLMLQDQQTNPSHLSH